MDADADHLRAPFLQADDDEPYRTTAASAVAFSEVATVEGCKLQTSCFLADGSSSGQAHSIVQKKLLAACILCAIFMVVEVVGGYYAHSVAIMSDAAHMLSDVSSFLVALFAAWAAQQPGGAGYSFGYHRAEIMGALVSVLVIWLVTGALVFEAVQRVLTPVLADGKLMFIVSGAGVVFNLAVALVLGHAHSPLGGHSGCSHSHPHSHPHGAPHCHGSTRHRRDVHPAHPPPHTHGSGCCGHPHPPTHGHPEDACALQQDPQQPPAAVAITICPTMPPAPRSALAGRHRRTGSRCARQQPALGAPGAAAAAGPSGAAIEEEAAVDAEAGLFQAPSMLHAHHAAACCGGHGGGASGSGSEAAGGGASGYASGSSSCAEDGGGGTGGTGRCGAGHAHAHGSIGWRHSPEGAAAAGAEGMGGADSACARGLAQTPQQALPAQSIHRFDGGCHGSGRPPAHDRGGCHGHDEGHGRGGRHGCGHGQEQGHGHGHAHESINLRGAVLHVIGDLLQSIGVAIAGLLIWIHQDDPRWYLADPLCTFAFSILVLLTTRAILRDIFHVLMERAPPRLDVARLTARLHGLPGVHDVHDLHVWTLSMGLPVLTAHVHIVEGADAGRLLRAFDALCAAQGIRHTTLQICNPGVQLSPASSGALTDSSACRSD